MDEEYRGQDSPVQRNKLPLEHQDKAIADLHATIGDLANRLKFVLTPDNTPKDAELSTDNAVATTSPLAQHIFANAEEMYLATTRIRKLMERLEI